MTSLTIVSPAPPDQRSGIGGRPFEWRALEEASAFERWFQGRPSPSPDPQGSQSCGEHHMPGTSVSEAKASEQRTREVGGQRSAEEVVGADVQKRSGGRPSIPMSDGSRTSLSYAASLGMSRISPARALLSPEVTAIVVWRRFHWSETAVRATVVEDGVHLSVRDAALLGDERTQLLRMIKNALKGLGLRLSELKVNGRAVTAVMGDSYGN